MLDEMLQNQSGITLSLSYPLVSRFPADFLEDHTFGDNV